MFHMPMFTFISGYFCVKSKRSTKEKVIDTTILYVLVQLFYTSLNYAYVQDKTVKFILFWPHWTLWYLMAMILWYILSDYVNDKKKWLIVSIIVGLYIGVDTSVSGYASISRVIVYLPYFVAGMMFKTEYIKKIKKEKWKILIMAIIILVSLYLLKDYLEVDYFFEYSGYSEVGDNTLGFFIRLYHYAGSVITILAVMVFMPDKEYKLSMIGANSLIMYIIHAAVIKVFQVKGIFNYSTYTNAIFSELNVVLMCMIMTIFYLYVKKLLIAKYRKVYLGTELIK